MANKPSKYRDMLQEIVDDPNTAITFADLVTKPGAYSVFLMFDDDMSNPREFVATSTRITQVYEEYKQLGHCRWELHAPSVIAKHKEIAENLTKYREMADEFDKRYGRSHAWRYIKW